MAAYLITGAAGFIGSHLTHTLVSRGDTVRAFDNFMTGSRRNLARILHRIEFHEGDLRDAEAVSRACEGVDYILHQGALPSGARSVKDPRTSHESNLDGTFNLLEGAGANGVSGWCMRLRLRHTATSGVSAA